jgi:dihydroorotase
MNEPTPCDLLVDGGIIADVAPPGTIDIVADCIDLAGRLLMPGLFDMHVHLRDPGLEHKETIASGSRAAAVGGFTGILAMPNTQPPIDNGSLVGYVMRKASLEAKTRVYQAGALTAGQKGESLSEMADMAEAGAIAFTDDGRGVQDAGLMRLALEYASTLDRPVLTHCQDESLSAAGQINEGEASTRLGLAGWPAIAEEVQIARDIALAEAIGASLHIQHVSTAAGLQLIAAAKARRAAISCEVTPHHLFLDESALDVTYDTNLKMSPPLRTAADVEALRQALASGLIDCVASDHAPHAAHEKSQEFELAPFGVTGLETALACLLTVMVHPGRLSYADLVERMAHAPRRILGLAPVGLAPGRPADITVIDPDREWVVDPQAFYSRSANSAFIGRVMKGVATDAFVGGQATLLNGEVI